jgi:glycogen(starch) synthase
MRVVHLTWEYPPIVYGGLGRHVQALSTAQVAAGHEVTIVTQRPQGAPEDEVLHGVHVVRVAPDGPFPYHLPSLLPWVGALDHRISDAASHLAGADVVHAHDWVVGRAGSAAAAALDVALVATIHATEAGRHGGWLPDVVARGVHMLERWLVDEADELVVCSQSMAAEVAAAHGADRGGIHVIPNGIDAAGYSRPSEIPDHLRDGWPRLGFVGRLEWEKGVFTAVDAMPRVLREHPGAVLRMVGTGGQAGAVDERVRRLGLSQHVRMFGRVDEDTLRAVYSCSDLLLVPSSYEPFGLVALEAAAMGAPLVVGDTGGLAEFVTDERGRRCRPGDPADLADQILAAVADPSGTERRAAAARAALSDYTWGRVAELTDAVYCAARRGPHRARVVRAAPTDRPVLPGRV